MNIIIWEGTDEKIGGTSKSNKEQVKEGKLEKVTKTKTNTNENEEELNTETEEANNMGADTEVIGVSGLQEHVEGFHANGAAAAMCTEEVENRMTEATDAKNSKGLVTGTISGQETAIKDGRDSNELEEKNTMDGKKGTTEELDNNDEKAGNMENNSNTTSHIIIP